MPLIRLHRPGIRQAEEEVMEALLMPTAGSSCSAELPLVLLSIMAGDQPDHPAMAHDAVDRR